MLTHVLSFLIRGSQYSQIREAPLIGSSARSQRLALGSSGYMNEYQRGVLYDSTGLDYSSQSRLQDPLTRYNIISSGSKFAPLTKVRLSDAPWCIMRFDFTED